MQNRTFIRIMLDIFFNNALIKSIVSVVNFCKEQQYYNPHELKFFKNVPINRVDIQPVQNKFLFRVNK